MRPFVSLCFVKRDRNTFDEKKSWGWRIEPSLDPVGPWKTNGWSNGERTNVPCNLIQARQCANTDGRRSDANLILAGFQLQKCQGDFAIEMHRNIIIRCNFGNAAARELRTDP